VKCLAGGTTDSSASCYSGYSGKKLEDNVQCEIFQTILEEAQGAYKPDIVYELPSNTPDDMEENVDKITAWVEEWKLRALS
jgi:adenylate kinase